MSMIKLLTPVFRVSFPQVFEPRAIQPGQTPKYSMTMLFDLSKINTDKSEKKRWDDLIAAVKEVAKEKFPKGIPANMMNPFRDGKEKEQYQGYGAGITFVNATTTTRPGLVDQSLQKIIAPEEFYAGCYARATVNPYAWSKVGKNGVSLGLQNIQKVAEGEAFSGRTPAEEDFSALESAAEETPGDNSAPSVAESLFG